MSGRKDAPARGLHESAGMPGSHAAAMTPAREATLRSEREHFDRLAESEGESWWGNRTAAAVRRQARRAILVDRALAGAADPLVLEIGCGTGTFTRHVLGRRPELRLVGCDVSPKSIRLAAERCARFPGARFEVADATALPYESGSFDAVIGCSILHHLPLRPALAEALRVLRPGGRFWFSEPNMMNPQTALERNVRFIGRLLQNSPGETAHFRRPMARALNEAGFAEVSVEPFDFVHPLVPGPLLPFVERLGAVLERIPLVREVAGSLAISAIRPR